MVNEYLLTPPGLGSCVVTLDHQVSGEGPPTLPTNPGHSAEGQHQNLTEGISSMGLTLMAEFQAHKVPEASTGHTRTTAHAALADKPLAEACTHEQWLQ